MNRKELSQILYNYDNSHLTVEQFLDSFFENGELEKRKQLFYNRVYLFAMQFERKMLDEFCSYWCEHSEGAKKMRFEKESVFDIEKRLTRWKNNAKPTNNKQSVTSLKDAALGVLNNAASKNN